MLRRSGLGHLPPSFAIFSNHLTLPNRQQDDEQPNRKQATGEAISKHQHAVTFPPLPVAINPRFPR